MKVFFFTAGDSQNWNKSVLAAIPVERIESLLGPLLSSHLRASAPSGIFGWGCGVSAYRTHEQMREGDIVVGCRQGSAGCVGEVAIAIRARSPELSQELWGAPDWPYVFLMRNLRIGAVPTGIVLARLGENGDRVLNFRLSNAATAVATALGEPSRVMDLVMPASDYLD